MGSIETQRGRLGLRCGYMLGGLLALAGASGCHHRRAQPVVIPPQTPVALVDIPESADLPMVQEHPSELPAVPTAASAGKPKKTRRRTPKAVATASAPAAAGTAASAGGAKKPQEIASGSASGVAAKEPDAAVAGLGSLTVGGEQSPRALQDANDLIASNERRLSGLSADVVKAQSELIGKVRNFQKEAQSALNSADADGAKTLAMKGKLLLDDLEKTR